MVPVQATHTYYIKCSASYYTDTTNSHRDAGVMVMWGGCELAISPPGRSSAGDRVLTPPRSAACPTHSAVTIQYRAGENRQCFGQHIAPSDHVDTQMYTNYVKILAYTELDYGPQPFKVAENICKTILVEVRRAVCSLKVK